tara:strand:+ start:18095 stop:18910 length:816 start_codon:yes stop_codon:yes gene_type:complete
MMNEIDAFILGIIQGITEFLPVSSSGHLEIARHILGANMLSDKNLLMTTVLHFATALSTIIVFKKDIISLFDGIFLKKNKKSKSFLIKIIIAIIPAGLVGLFLMEEIENLFIGNLVLVGVMLILTGVMLFLTKIIKPGIKQISKMDSLIIGLSQALAIIPGISRSGSTICTSIFLNNNKNDAAKFSFLIVIPVIFGAILKNVLEIISNYFENGENSFLKELDFSVLFIGFLASFTTGIFACKLVLKVVRNNNLIYFSFYCFILGLISIFIL